MLPLAKFRRSVALVAGLVAMFALPSAAFGQATRTWISGVGDDANPCSRTAPCKTFAGAISKTAAGGEINVLDPAAGGAVTITKSITIKARGDMGAILSSGTNGIVVNAGVNDRVTISGLDLNGVGTGPDGIRVLQVGSLRVERVHIYNYAFAGIDFRPSNAGARLVVSNSSIYDIRSADGTTGSGVVVEPTGSGTGTATISKSDIDTNQYGVVASGVALAARINVSNSTISNSKQIGVFANGANARVRLSSTDVTDNGMGLVSGNSGQLVSFGNNRIADNTTNGAPTGLLPLG